MSSSSSAVSSHVSSWQAEPRGVRKGAGEVRKGSGSGGSQQPNHPAKAPRCSAFEAARVEASPSASPSSPGYCQLPRILPLAEAAYGPPVPAFAVCRAPGPDRPQGRGRSGAGGLQRGRGGRVGHLPPQAPPAGCLPGGAPPLRARRLAPHWWWPLPPGHVRGAAAAAKRRADRRGDGGRGAADETHGPTHIIVMKRGRLAAARGLCRRNAGAAEHAPAAGSGGGSGRPPPAHTASLHSRFLPHCRL